MNFRRWIITVFVCVLITATLATYKFLEIKSAIDYAEAMPEFSETVKATRVKTVKYAPYINVIGEAVMPQHVKLTNELPGRITSVNFSSGEMVKKGQIILQLDISEEKANLSSAKARETLALSIYKRNQALRKKTAVSQEKLDRSKADLSISKADIAALKSIINKKTIRAPFDGTIGIHQFEIGQYLQNNTPITTLIGNNDFIWIDFSLPQFYKDLDIGTQVHARLVRNTLQNDAPNIFFSGKVIARNSIISNQSRSRAYRIKVQQKNQSLVHNSLLEVTVPVAKETLMPAVPTTAVQNDSLGQYVYLLIKDNNKEGYRSKRRQVTVNGRVGDDIIITSGLKEGELIASAGGFKLHENGLVYIGKSSENPAIQGGDK